MHYACWFDLPEVVTALMREGASLKARSWGWNASNDPYCT